MLALSENKRRLIRFIDAVGRALGLQRLRPLPSPEDVRSLLVLELWGIGDVVLATAGLEGLRRRYPRARITLLAQAHSREVLAHCPWPDEIVAVKFPWTAPAGKYRLWRWPWLSLFRLFRDLRGRRFDLAVDARMDL